MKIIAHRANDINNLKENSKEAILNALNKEYIDGVEFDIRLTKDNYFVLHHNATYKNNLIKNKKLNELTLNELNDVLKNIISKKIILIDIKYEEKNFDKLVNNLIKILKKYQHLNIYLCSFNYELCIYLKNNTNSKTGLIISSIINKNKNYSIFDFISIKYSEYKKIDKETFIWTVNKEEVLEKLIDTKVYIITDKPYLVLKQ